jgi:hypothetical protein
MARSTTTYAPKWQCGKTCVIRVPSKLADEIMTVAWALDSKRAKKYPRSPGKVGILAAKKARMLALKREVDHLRNDCEFSAPGEVLFASPTDSTPNGLVIVTADGLGGAVTSIVAGNYPLDFQTLSSRQFSSESRAMKMADRITSG